MSKNCIPLEQERNVNTNHIHNAHHGDPDQSSPESHEGEDAVIKRQAILVLVMLTRCSMRRCQPALTWKISITWWLYGRTARKRSSLAASFVPFWQARSLVARYRCAAHTHTATLPGDNQDRSLPLSAFRESMDSPQNKMMMQALENSYHFVSLLSSQDSVQSPDSPLQ